MKTYFIKDDDFSENDNRMNVSAINFNMRQSKYNFFAFYTHVDNKKKTVAISGGCSTIHTWRPKKLSYNDIMKQFDKIESEIASILSDINILYNDARKYGYTML